MLRHRQPGARRHERRSSRNIEGMRPITAGPTGIYDLRIPHPDFGRASSHGLYGAGDLGHGLPLHPKPHEISGDLGGGRRAVHDLAHHGLSLLFGEVRPFGQCIDCVFDHEGRDQRSAVGNQSEGLIESTDCRWPTAVD
jgi:hypothetical protein